MKVGSACHPTALRTGVSRTTGPDRRAPKKLWGKPIRGTPVYYYISESIAKKDPNVTAPIPTNLFLYFAVVPVGAE
jgi:hypothetical protein